MSTLVPTLPAAFKPAPFFMKVDEYIFSGPVDKDFVSQKVADGNKFASWLCLHAGYGEDQCPRSSLGPDVPYVELPLEVPQGLTAQRAKAVQDALAGLPKPVWIQCTVGARSSAAALLYLARQHGWSLEKAMAYAMEQSLPMLKHEPLRNWVTATLSPAPGAAVSGSQPPTVVFRQLFESVSSTFTYIVGCAETREAVIIDPVLEKADRDVVLVNELGLHLKYALNTHVHADHVSGTGALKRRFPDLKSLISARSGGEADELFGDNQLIVFGKRSLKGHTVGCTTFVLDDASMAFTGDALFVRGCGRTDFQGGSAAALYDSIHGTVFQLQESCVIYPGHDYNGHARTTVAEERRYNPRLNKTRDEFIAIMENLKLPAPKLIDVAVPQNLHDGEQVPAPLNQDPMKHSA